MKRYNFRWLCSLVIVFLSLTLGGCGFVGGVFEFGLWSALVLIIILVLLVYLVIRLFRGKR